MLKTHVILIICSEVLFKKINYVECLLHALLIYLIFAVFFLKIVFRFLCLRAPLWRTWGERCPWDGDTRFIWLPHTTSRAVHIRNMHIYRSGHIWKNKEREGQPTVSKLGRLIITSNDRYNPLRQVLATFLHRIRFLRIVMNTSYIVFNYFRELSSNRKFILTFCKTIFVKNTYQILNPISLLYLIDNVLC